MRLDAKLIMEEFEENPFLVDFYKNSEQYAFQTQLFFLLSRYRQQQQLQQTDLFIKTLISDYMFVKDRLFAALNLNDNEMSLYNSVATILEKNIAVPDMVIFLQSVLTVSSLNLGLIIASSIYLQTARKSLSSPLNRSHAPLRVVGWNDERLA